MSNKARNGSVGLFKKAMAMVLAVATIIGFVPIMPVQAAPPAGVPASIWLESINYEVTYTSPNTADLGDKTMYLHDMKFTDQAGLSTTGFCMNHDKLMHSNRTAAFAYSKTYSAGQLHCQPFLDWYTFHSRNSEKIDEQYPNLTEDQKKATAEGQGISYWSSWLRTTTNGWVQAALWLELAGAFSGPSDAVGLQKIAKERERIFDQYYPSGGHTASEAASRELLDMIIDGHNSGVYGTPNNYHYYTYTGSNTNTQDIMIAESKAATGSNKGFLKITKVDSAGNNLPNAVFGVYADSACTTLIETISTTSSWNIIEVTNSLATDYNGDVTATTFYIKEMLPPPGYKLDETVYPVTVDPAVHNTMGNAALVNGSGKIINAAGDPPTGNIQKVDAETGAGIGPAIFQFEGQTAAGQYYSHQWTTDASGNLDIQWSDESELDTYVPPGQYTVTEIQPPQGYVLDTNSQHLVLEYDKTTGVTNFPGPLVFRNYKEDSIMVTKIDGEGTKLDGAFFSVYFNGSYLTDIGPTVNGEISFNGADGNGCQPGYYEFKEITAPGGHLIGENCVKGVWVHPDDVGSQNHRLVFVNFQYPEIVISKTENGTTIPLEGAVFEIMIDGEVKWTLPTGKDGKIIINYSQYGQYLDPNKESWTISAREVTPPDGYLLDDDNWQIHELKKGETMNPFTFTDTKYPEIVITKRDSETGEYLPNTSFKIMIDGKLFGTCVTDAEGKIVIKYEEFERFLDENNRDNWTITVTETEMPQYYNKDKQEASGDYTLTQTLKWGQSLSVFEFKDTHYRDIMVMKLDDETGKALEGATFELKSIYLHDEAQGTISRVGVTGPDGTFTFENLPNGTYEITETIPPTGYELTKPNKQTVIVTSTSDRVITVIFSNAPQRCVQIWKTDAVTGAYVAFAEFEVWNTSMTKLYGTYVTDKTGMACSEVLPLGDYIVKESKAPAGYQLNEEHFHITIEADRATILKVADVPLTAIMVAKFSTVDDTPLMGAKFEYRTADGYVLGEITTDTTGTAVTPVLEPGVYYLREVEAPDGYLLTDEVFRVEVKAGMLATLVVENSPECSLVIFKGDSNTKKGLAGAVFKVETADGDFIGEYTTDAQGEALIRPVTPGHYIVTEMAAPEGYIVSENPKTITVKVGVINRVEFYDGQKGALVIRLEDQKDGHKLENGRFQLYLAETGDLIDEGVTDNSGSIVFGNLVPGRYIIKQTYPPEGYTIVDDVKEGIVYFGDTTVVVFKDCTAGILIEKLDKLTSEPLSGARFQVIRNTDNIVVGEYVTDVDGLALADGLTPGMYTVKEIVPPTGYALTEDDSQLAHVKEGETAHVTFLNIPEAGITISAVDKDNNKPLSGVVVEVWHQNGELVNTFTTDITGTVQTNGLTAGFYVLKVIKVEDGYTAIVSEKTVEIKNGVPVTVKFEFAARGILQIMALNSNEQGLPGMKVTVTKQNGEFIGNYITDSTGMIKVPGLEAGWFIVSETAAPDGYNIGTDAKQSVEITSNGDAQVKFYHAKTVGLQIRTTVKQTSEMVAGVKYEITELSGAIVGQYTSDALGIAFAELTPGWYVVSQVELPNGYKNYSLCESRNVLVKADVATIVEFELSQLSSIRVKFIDGTTNAPLYNVHVLLKDSAGKIIDEYASNNEGYITLKESVLNGTYTLTQISVPSGYTIDSIPKTVEILNGETTEVTWKMYTTAGQIQVHLTSSAYNSVLDKAAGSNLQGAVFEVYDPFTYAVVATIETDSYGVAASNGLPIGRYIIREKSPAPYYGLSGKETEVYIKIENDVVRVEYQAAPLTLSVLHTMKANTDVTPGTSMKTTFTAVNNTSGERLDNFFWNIKVPTDAMRAGTLYTGTWTTSVFYSISYKTNMADYRTLATGLNSTTAYQYDLSSLALNVQGGEYVTDIRFEFGTVPSGFSTTINPIFYGYVMPSIPHGYKIIIRSECGGKYGEQWCTASALWTTSAVTGKGTSSTGYPSNLPKAGY